jgi:ElaA protein
VRWQDKSFNQLTVHELYAILALRQRVFAVEQVCAYLDADGVDPDCHHLWAELSGPAPGRQGAAGPDTARVLPSGATVVAYLRVVPSLRRFPEICIGRVVTAPEVRGTGVGRELMQRGLALVHRLAGPVAIRIGAQARLERFYEEFGFVRASADYEEDGIPHLEMLRAAPAA